MENAALQLQCSELLVMIPHAGMIMVMANGDTDPDHPFVRKAGAEFEKIAEEPLTDLGFVYRDQQITGVAALRSPHTANRQLEMEPAEGEHFKLIKMPVFTGDFFYKVEIGAVDEHRLIDLCERGIFYLLQNGIHQPRFLGIIEFVIDQNINPCTARLDEKLTRFWASLQQASRMKDMCNRLRRSIELSIIFSGGFAGGEKYKKKHFRLEYHK